MQIRIHPLLFLYYLTMTALTSWETTTGAIVSLSVHELGHLAACCLSGNSIASLELTPFGGIMTYAQGKAPSKGIKGIGIAAAGPIANYLLLAALGSFPDLLEHDLQKAIMSSNAAMLLINLMPVLPLDGGQILFCLGYYVFPVACLISALSGMGIAVGTGFLLLSIYGAVKMGYFNCSLAIVGIHLSYCAWKCRSQRLAENLFVILQERAENTLALKRIKQYRVSGDTQLISLVPLLGGSAVCEFIYDEEEEEEEEEHKITEKMLCRKLLESTALSVRDAFS